MARAAGNHGSVAIRHNNLALIALRLGDFVTARGHALEAIGLCERYHIMNQLGGMLNRLAEVEDAAGDLAAAHTAALRALAVTETQGDRFGTSECHETLARLHLRLGEPDGARRHIAAALDIGMELDAPRLLWTALATASTLAQEQGTQEAAARWLAVSESLRESLGEDLGPVLSAHRAQRIATLAQALGEDGLRRAFATASALSPRAAASEETVAIRSSASYPGTIRNGIRIASITCWISGSWRTRSSGGGSR